jgi:hypothetical protein
LTSDRNQFPTNMAATSGASIFKIVTKSGTVFLSVYNPKRRVRIR